MKYCFSLNDEQEKELEDWKDKIKELHGSYGIDEFTFIPNNIGTAVYVKNSFVKVPLDLSHVEKW